VLPRGGLGDDIQAGVAGTTTHSTEDGRSVHPWLLVTGSRVIGGLGLISIGKDRALPSAFQDGLQLREEIMAQALVGERTAARINGFLPSNCC
jgi:hypothetical protein